MIQQENPAISIAFASKELKDLRKIRIKSDEINFAKSLRPIYKFSRAFGLMPFTIVLDEKYNIKGARVRPLDIARCTVAISLCTVMAVIYYQYIELPKDQNVSIILIYGDAILIIVGLIYACTATVLDMINRYKISAILKSLNNFDNSVCIFVLIN